VTASVASVVVEVFLLTGAERTFVEGEAAVVGHGGEWRMCTGRPLLGKRSLESPHDSQPLNQSSDSRDGCRKREVRMGG